MIRKVVLEPQDVLDAVACTTTSSGTADGLEDAVLSHSLDAAGSLYLYNDYKKKNIQSIKNIRPKMKASID